MFETASVDDRLRLLEWPVGHEYVNGYSTVIAAALEVNHEIKLLAAGEGKLNHNYSTSVTNLHDHCLDQYRT